MSRASTQSGGSSPTTTMTGPRPVPMPVTLDVENPFELQVAEIVRTHRERNSQYMQSPLTILPMEDWLTQVAIKGVRAQQAIPVAKIRDELIDVAVYAIMALEQIDLQSWSRAIDSV